MWCVLNICEFWMSDESWEKFSFAVEFVLTNSSFICDLLSYELCMSSACNRMVDGVYSYQLGVCMNKLCELDVIGEDVEWKVWTFKDGNKFRIIGNGVVISGFTCCCISSNDVVSFVDPWFLLEVSYSKANLLSVEISASLDVIFNLISC